MSSKLKNYTTEVPVSKTIGEIEHLLVEAGASAIMKEYNGQQLAGVSFRIRAEWGEMYVAMPVNSEKAFKVFMQDRNDRGCYTTDTQRVRFVQQAERTAWRILKDWVAVQLSLIQMDQAKAEQVFLPYMVTGRTPDGKAITMYQIFHERKMKELPEHKGD